MARSRSRALRRSVSACWFAALALASSSLVPTSSASDLDSWSPSTEIRSRSASERLSSALRAASTLLFSCSARITAVSSLRRLSSASFFTARSSSASCGVCLCSSSSRARYRWLSCLRPSCSTRSASSHFCRSDSAFARSSSTYAWRWLPCSASCWSSLSSMLFLFCASVLACSIVARASSASCSIVIRRSLSCWILVRCWSDFSVRATITSFFLTTSSVCICTSRSSFSYFLRSSSISSSSCSRACWFRRSSSILASISFVSWRSFSSAAERASCSSFHIFSVSAFDLRVNWMWSFASVSLLWDCCSSALNSSSCRSSWSFLLLRRRDSESNSLAILSSCCRVASSFAS
mmetsp:Transcript_44865/g.106417  ORF Transcript_44865/g.106417 Transcript_44865/m.106417 type:complete len:350 (+) Transcript_44865:749-1798(+)